MTQVRVSTFVETWQISVPGGRGGGLKELFLSPLQKLQEESSLTPPTCALEPSTNPV